MLLLSTIYILIVAPRGAGDIARAKKPVRKRKKKREQPKHHNPVILKLPHMSEDTDHQVRRAIARSGLPITAVFTPGMKLRDILTSSRPRDKEECPRVACKTCDALDDATCTKRNTVYKITCTTDNCGEEYIGETGRPTHERFTEHLRSAKNPEKASYMTKPLAVHYREKHPNTDPSLSLHLLETANNTLERKIKEAKNIARQKPTINQRDEMLETKQFLVQT